MIALVVAYSKNRVIGRDGDLPWRFAGDLKRFKALTMGSAVIMGRKTWVSLPRKPLPGRLNIVLTRADSFTADGASVATTIDEALQHAAGQPSTMVIGGGEIYRAFLPIADTVYATEINAEIAGDTFFPELPEYQWEEVSRVNLAPSTGDTVSGEFVTYHRRNIS